MNDLNFFHVETAKENDAEVKKVVAIVGSIASIAIVGSLGINSYGIYRANKSIADLNMKVNEEVFNSKYEESLVVAKEKQSLSKYNDILNEIFASVSDRNKLNPKFIHEISYTIPKEVYFKSMNFTGGVVEISASSTKREAIAEFQHNINEVEFIKESHIGGIMSDLSDDTKEVFSFTITCKLEEAYYNEGE
ncbi:MAG: PilN domain-containing protein [Clostridium sp.]|uniref:PilN domain-containing protein n=1 Tax=Clostridium sp. TaxID=1506 RepID=UPI00303AC5B9